MSAKSTACFSGIARSSASDPIRNFLFGSQCRVHIPLEDCKRLRCKHIPGLILHFIPIQVNGLSCNTRHDPWTPVALFLRENQTIVFLNFIKPIILSPVYRTQWANSNHLFFLPKENLKRYLHTGMIHCRLVCRIDAICYGNSIMEEILRKLIHTHRRK